MMTDKRTLRAVIRGILSEVDGPNDPKSPRNPAYYSMPSKLSIAATLLPTAYDIFKGFENTGIIQNDFPITNMEALGENPTSAEIEVSIESDFKSLESLYDNIDSYKSLGWPSSKSFWKGLNATQQGDVKALVAQMLQPKSSTPVTAALVVNKIDKTGNSNPTRQQLVDFILMYLASNHDLFQQKTRSLKPGSPELSSEANLYASAAKHFKNLPN